MFQIAFNDFGIFAFRTAGHFYVVEPLIITISESFNVDRFSLKGPEGNTNPFPIS